MLKTTRLFFAVSVAALLSGCLVPEKFDASIHVKPDGGYTFQYRGTAVNGPAAAFMKERGSLPAADEAKLRRDAEQARSMPGVKSMSYKGKGRYEMQLHQELKPGEQINTLKIFTVSRNKEGVYSVAGMAVNEADRKQLQQIGIKIDGKAEVFLPANAKVIDHNANGTPGFFSKSYKWAIGANGQQPYIRFTLN